MQVGRMNATTQRFFAVLMAFSGLQTTQPFSQGGCMRAVWKNTIFWQRREINFGHGDLALRCIVLNI
jgi:hypothetical protein